MGYITVTRYTKNRSYLGFESESEQSFSVSADMFDTFLQRKRNRWSHLDGGSFTECPGFMGIYAKDSILTYKWEAK